AGLGEPGGNPRQASGRLMGLSWEDAMTTTSTRIQKTPGVCGGDARIGDTRIPVWLLVLARKQGQSDAHLLDGYPSLTAADLDAGGHGPRVGVEALRLLGHDALTVQDDGRANLSIPDPEVLARATLLGRVVLTNNRRHFHTLHRVAPVHAGIVTYTHDPDPVA